MSKNRALDWWKPAACGVSMMLYASALTATPFARLSVEDVVLTLYKDKCRIESEIKNLPGRAVWSQGGKDVEGCFGVNGNIGVVTFYFADKTATSIPMRQFVGIQGA